MAVRLYVPEKSRRSFTITTPPQCSFKTSLVLPITCKTIPNLKESNYFTKAAHNYGRVIHQTRVEVATLARMLIEN